MVYRLSWVAGGAGILLALGRSSRLLRPTIEGLPWQAVMIAAALLGGAITWAAVAYRIRGRWVTVLNFIAATLTLVRISVPETTWFVFPTTASVPALGEELALARDVIGSGIAPVMPFAGIVAVMAVVFWALGAVLAWGLLANRPYVAVLAPLLVYLEFAVMDRRPGGVWTVWLMLAIGASLLAVMLDQRRSGTGLLTSRATRRALDRSLPSLGIAVVGAVVAVSLLAGQALAGAVPRSGYLAWRTSTSLTGEYLGSIQYNPFVGIRQSLVSSSTVPVFSARVEGGVDPRTVYWRLLTLDSFNGLQWHVGGGAGIASIDDIDTFEPPSTAFLGPVSRVTSTVTISQLQMDWLPAPYAPISFSSPDRTVERGLRVKRDDGSLRFDALTYRGMSYTVISQVPVPDLRVLSLGDDGDPSVVFAAAIEDGAFDLGDEPLEYTTRSLPDRAHFLDLPDDIGNRIPNFAHQQVAGLETDYERGLALEALFKTGGGFQYSTQIVPGHSATDLEAWLLDPSSPNYRVGYCEQYATAMGVMARAVGIPSRVVLGFTPGSYADDGTFVVRDRNAHAWVELWMPTQGWVTFDPTPRGDGVNPGALEAIPFAVAEYLEAALPEPGSPTQPTLPGQTPLEEDPTTDPSVVTTVPTTDAGENASPGLPVPFRAVGIGLLVVALVAALPVLKWGRRRSRVRRLEDGDIGAAWVEIVDRLTDLGEGPPLTATPAEIARRATAALAPLAVIYARAAYGPPGTPSPEDVAAAGESFQETEFQIVGRYSLGRRIASRYSLRSLRGRANISLASSGFGLPQAET
ncbi:MAG: DUF3488 and transglutaminase-like domain-containing protein [Acidimicrobiia bacterium]